MHTITLDAFTAHPAKIADMAGDDPVRISRPGAGDLILVSFRAYDRLLRMEEYVSKAAHIATVQAE